METNNSFLPTLQLDDSNRGLIFLKDDLSVDFCNEAFAKMMGMTRSEVRGMSKDDFVHPDDIAQQKDKIGQYQRGEISEFKAQQRVIRKDGSVFWVEKEYHRFYRDDSSLIYWVVVYTEIAAPNNL